MSTLLCTSCQHPNPAGSTVCALCQAPLQMTQIAANPLHLTSIAAIGSIPTGPTLLVPLSPSNQEESSRAIPLPTTNPLKLGWRHFETGNFPEIDLAELFPDRLVELENGKKLVAVSRKTGSLRCDNVGNVFISADMDSSSKMWVQEAGSKPMLVLPGNEAFLKSGMLIFLGKENRGMTFIVR